MAGGSGRREEGLRGRPGPAIGEFLNASRRSRLPPGASTTRAAATRSSQRQLPRGLERAATRTRPAAPGGGGRARSWTRCGSSRTRSNRTSCARRAASRPTRTAPRWRSAAAGRHECDLKAAMVGTVPLPAEPRGWPIPRSSPRAATPSSSTTSATTRTLDDGEILVNDTRVRVQHVRRGRHAELSRLRPVLRRPEEDLRDRARRAEGGLRRGPAGRRRSTTCTTRRSRSSSTDCLKLGILSGDRDGDPQDPRLPEVLSPRLEPLDRPERARCGRLRESPASRLERYGKAEALLARDGLMLARGSTPQRSTGPRWWNIGVRIEDTVLVTASGVLPLRGRPAPSHADVRPSWRRAVRRPAVMRSPRSPTAAIRAVAGRRREAGVRAARQPRMELRELRALEQVRG